MAKRKPKQAGALTKGKATLDYGGLVSAIEQAHDAAQQRATQAVNLALTLRNWLIGYYIVEYEQHDNDRARYGDELLRTLARDLRQRLGRGFAQRNLFRFRGFYLRYPILPSVMAKFGVRLPSPPSVSLTPLEWQDDAYFEQLFREVPWTHFLEFLR